MGLKLFRYVTAFIALSVSAWFFMSYGRTAFVFHGDAGGYYMYLPSTFIYHNHTHVMELPTDRGIDQMIIDGVKKWPELNKPTPKGYILNQYTYGVALMELPFFAAAHAYELATGGGANGFSQSYSDAIKLSSIIFALLGLVLTYRVLRNYFSATVALLASVVVYLGSNLFWFTICEAGMAHVVLFFLYALLVFLTIRLYRRPSAATFATLGLAAGVITLIRPTDIICLLIPLLYGVSNRRAFSQRIQFIRSNGRGILVAALLFILPMIPQMIYWKTLSGSFIYYSYGSQTFDWRHPHIIDGLFSGFNGWLAYSPAMVFAVLGLFLYRSVKDWNWCLWTLFPLYAYIIYSWYCWYYINGLGSRPMIHLYALMAIPLAAFLVFMEKRHALVRICFGLVLLFFITLNLNFTVQQAKGILMSEQSNWTYNMRMLFRGYTDYNDLVCYDTGDPQPDSAKLTRLATLATMDFEQPASDHYIADPSGRSKYVYAMRADDYLPATLDVIYSKQKFGDAKWIKCGGRFKYFECIGYRHALCLSINRGSDNLLNRYVTIDNKIAVPYHNVAKVGSPIANCQTDIWGSVFFFTKIPAGIRDGDVIKCFPWNLPHKDILVDDLAIEIYK
jgi:hypothetical protein